MNVNERICTYMYILCSICPALILFSFVLTQDYVMFTSIPPPPHYRGKPSEFSPAINKCWYGRVTLIFKMRVRTDAGLLMECQCALIETMYDYRLTKSKS